MRRILKLGSTSVLSLVLLYAVSFVVWWQTSPVTTMTVQGKQYRSVELHFNAFFWRTQIIWIPAFWFMEHVGGYEFDGFAGMEEHSVIRFTK